MARSKARTQSCDRSDALTRLAQSESFLLAAELVVDDDSDDATPSVAASLAVLAGIAASDAACCARLGTVEPHGADMAKDLQRLLNRKDDSQYGLTFVSSAEAGRVVGWAKRLLSHARRAVEA
jgi:hypothetical protein